MKSKQLITLFVVSTSILSLHAQHLPYQNPSLSAEQRAEDLCSRLTLEEKCKLMQNGSPAIKRLNIPAFEWWSEALHGTARNGFATVFPNTTGMAASWNDQLLLQIFSAIGNESRIKNTLARKSGNIKRYQGLSIWTPNINIFRDPRWGRGQETYGEDPYLTGKMGLAVVEGLQGPKNSKYYKLLACAKHFAVHSGPEYLRHSFNIENLPARDLWETYLPAFKTLIQEGNVAEVMCAYHSMDGLPCCGSNKYLQQILRQDLGFKGMVVSDCGAIGDFWIQGRHEVAQDAAQASAQAVLAGTDVECGANYDKLPEAVKRGEISEEKINVSVKRLLKARFKLGDFDSDNMVEWTQLPESLIACSKHKQLAYQMAQESMTLLKNNGILPLQKNARIAVMGANANDSIMLWGNYNGYPTKTISILEGLQNKSKHISYIPGCGLTKNEFIDSRFSQFKTPDGKVGMRATYWNNTKMNGTPATTMDITEPINLSNGGATVFAPGVNLEHFSAKYEGTFHANKSEDIHLKLSSDDLARIIIDGDTIINSWKARERVNVSDKIVHVEANKDYKIQIDYVQNDAAAIIQFDLGPLVKMTEKELLQKVGDAQVVIYVGGISPRLEGEEMKVNELGFKGGDRTTIELPQSQRDMIALLHNSGKKVIFVNCSGGAIALEPESRNADAILQAWYGGEMGGQAVADVLFGDYNPNGKLPVTFYKNDSQLPDYNDYTMKGRTYRYLHQAPLYPFGYGLSYTTFAYDNAKYDRRKGNLSLEVTNTGKCEGTTTIQVYIRRTADINGPIKTLKAFQKVSLQANEKKRVTINLPRERFEGWDETTNTMRIVPGKYEIMVGQHSDDPDMKKLIIYLK